MQSDEITSSTDVQAISPDLQNEFTSLYSDLQVYFDEEAPSTSQAQIIPPSEDNPMEVTTDTLDQPESNNMVIENPNQKKRGSRLYKNSKREANKKLRMKGMPYKAYKKHDTQDASSKKKWKLVDRPARKYKSFCRQHPSEKDKTKLCSTFTDEECLRIRNSYTKCADLGARKTLLLSMIKVTDCKRTKESTRNEEIGNKNRRTKTVKYYLKKDSVSIQVCKLMFASAFGITEDELRGVVDKAPIDKLLPDLDIKPRSRGGGRRAEDKQDDDTLMLESFFEHIPKLPSHYCRKKTKKLYLNESFKTKIQLYTAYKQYCEEKNHSPFSSSKFFTYFEQQNMSIFTPKKDRCTRCYEYETGNSEWTEEDFHNHLKYKDEALQEKENDKKNTSDTTMVVTTDCEAVLSSPMNNSNKMYFRTKLNIHNQSYFDLKSHEGHCYLWNESDGGLDDSNFTSVHIMHLKEALANKENVDKLIIYADNCSPQNKNATLSSALLKLAVENQVEITQKFLAVGHTHMECDSMHMKIEQKLKKAKINIPSDYEDIITTARQKPSAYKVKTLNWKDFLDFEATSSIKSIRPGKKVGDECVKDLSKIRYTTDGKIYLKTPKMDDWMDNPQRGYQVSKENPTNLYTEPKKISRKKFQDLMELKTTINQIYWTYYEELPHH